MKNEKVTGQGVGMFLARLDPSRRVIVERLRSLIFEAEPEIEEGMRWGRPVYSKGGGICCIDTFPGYVSLGFFEGACLRDVTGLLAGTDENYRYIRIRDVESIRGEEIKALVAEAVRFHSRYVVRCTETDTVAEQTKEILGGER